MPPKKKLEKPEKHCENSSYWWNATGHMITTKHGLGADPGDTVACAEFGLYRFSGFGCGGVKVKCFPQDEDIRPIQHCIAGPCRYEINQLHINYYQFHKMSINTHDITLPRLSVMCIVNPR